MIETTVSSQAPPCLSGPASDAHFKGHDSEMKADVKIPNKPTINYTHIDAVSPNSNPKVELLAPPQHTHTKRHRHRRSAAISHDFGFEGIPGIESASLPRKSGVKTSDVYGKSVVRKSIADINAAYQETDSSDSSEKEPVSKNSIIRTKVSFASPTDVNIKGELSLDNYESDFELPHKRSSSSGASSEFYHSRSSSNTPSIISSNSSVTIQSTNNIPSNDNRNEKASDRTSNLSLSGRHKKVRSWAGSFFFSSAKKSESDANNNKVYDHKSRLSLDSPRSVSQIMQNDTTPTFPHPLSMVSLSSLPLDPSSNEVSPESPISTQSLTNVYSFAKSRDYQVECEEMIDLDAALGPFNNQSKTGFRKLSPKYTSNHLHLRSESLPNILDKFDEVSEETELQVDDDPSLKNRKRKTGLIFEDKSQMTVKEVAKFERETPKLPGNNSTEKMAPVALSDSSQELTTSHLLLSQDPQSKPLKSPNRYSRYANNQMTLAVKAVAEARKNKEIVNEQEKDDYIATDDSMEEEVTWTTGTTQIKNHHTEYRETYLDDIGQPGPLASGPVDGAGYLESKHVFSGVDNDSGRLSLKPPFHVSFMSSLNADESPFPSPMANPPFSEVAPTLSSDSELEFDISPHRCRHIDLDRTRKVVRQKKSIGYRIRDWVKAKIT